MEVFEDCIPFCPVSTCILNVLQNHVLDFIAFKTPDFCILRELSGGFGYTKGYGVVRVLSLNQTALNHVLRDCFVYTISLLDSVKRDNS